MNRFKNIDVNNRIVCGNVRVSFRLAHLLRKRWGCIYTYIHCDCYSKKKIVIGCRHHPFPVNVQRKHWVNLAR